MPTLSQQRLSEASRAFQAGRYEESCELLAKLLGVDERQRAQVLALYSMASLKAGDCQRAVDLSKEYAELQPSDADGWYRLGMCHAAAGQPGESLQAHQQAVKVDPDHTNALVNVGLYLGKAGFLERAILAFRRAIQLDPTNAAAHNNFANVLKDGGLVREAIEMYGRTLRLQPNLSGALSNYCYTHQFLPGITLKRLAELHDEWEDRFGRPCRLFWPEHRNQVDAERPLRVGFLSEDFRHHTVGHFLIKVIKNLADGLKVYCYSLSQREDEITREFQQLAEVYRQAHMLSDTQLFDRLQADAVDVLFDLSGHTSGNRLQVLARKPAPVQMTWLGYVGTTGLEAIDYKIGSHMSVPEGTEQWYSERILRFPHPYAHQAYWPCFGDVEIGPPPSSKNQYLTFGTFSLAAKINEQVIATWSSVLNAIPDSRLLLKGAAYRSEYICRRIADQFDAYGIERQRLSFEAFTPPPEAFQTYNEIDIVLDPWPFSGCTTTCEALWMGVPVVTLPQQTEASRHTASFLTALGMVEGIAHNDQHYKEIAVSLAQDEERRAYLRQNLREDFLNSAACDAEGCGRHLSAFIRSAWREWCGER